MRNLLSIAVIGALLVPAAAFAADTDSTSGWSGSGEVGLASAKGNTDSQTYVGKLNISKDIEQWSYAAGAQFLYTKSDGEESARRYEAFGSAAYNLDDRNYINSVLHTKRDHYATYEYQHTASVNYGYKAINNDRTKLIFEIGPGYRWAKIQDERIHENEVIGRGLVDFSHKLTDTTSFFNTLLVESGSSNTYIADDIGLQVQMSKALALKAAYQVHHNTDTFEGTKKTDTLTTVNVVYGF
jgi:putative salt-induced outer membrane protein